METVDSVEDTHYVTAVDYRHRAYLRHYGRVDGQDGRDVWQGSRAIRALSSRACGAHRVKLRHAVGLALIGWYLMTPPMDEHHDI